MRGSAASIGNVHVSVDGKQISVAVDAQSALVHHFQRVNIQLNYNSSRTANLVLSPPPLASSKFLRTKATSAQKHIKMYHIYVGVVGSVS